MLCIFDIDIEYLLCNMISISLISGKQSIEVLQRKEIKYAT